MPQFPPVGTTRNHGTLPATRHCMWKERLQETLQRLHTEDPLQLGADCRPDWKAELLQERRYSRILALRPSGQAQDRVHQRLESDAIILKLYHAVQAERRQMEFDDLLRVQQLSGPNAGHAVVRPVAVYPDLGALLTARAVGDPASERVRQACGRGAAAQAMASAAAVCTAAGSWLQGFQQSHALPAGTASPHLPTPQAFVDYVEDRLARMQQSPFALPDVLRQRARKILSATLASDATLLQPVCWSHSDFGPHNLLCDAQRITVLDFELIPQHPWFDAAYFVESLAGFSGLRYDAQHVGRLQRAFLNGYGLDGCEPLFLALRMRHLVCTAASLRAQRLRFRMRLWPDFWMLRTHLAELVQRLEASSGRPVAPAGHLLA